MAACSGSTTHSTTQTSSPQSTSSSSTTKPHATIPVVLGYTIQYTKGLMTAEGIGPIKDEARPNLYYSQNEVIGTNPPGKSAFTGSTVTLYVSGGITGCATCVGGGVTLVMPPVCGLTFQVANTLLVEKGITLNPHPISQASSKPAGEIIGSVPAAEKSFVAYGTPNAQEVVVTISSGPATSPAPSPSAGRPNTC